MADLNKWAASRLSQLLPLDPGSLSQVIDYALSLSREACADHLKNLLGDSPAALEFISSFNSRRESQRPPQSPSTQNSDATRSSGGAKKGKKKAPLHTAGPPRRPDNYGDVGGAYKKADEEDYMSSRKPTAPALTPSPHGSSASSRIPSPLPSSSPKPPPSASGPTISDMLPNVRSKVSKSTRQGGGAGPSSKGNTALTTNDISDLTAAIAALEVSTNPSLGERRNCTCYGSLHPVFDPAPNCLNCGKIICSLEGLQPCSFCGTPLLSAEEVQGMIRELRAERGQEKMRVHNEGVHHEGGPRPTPGSEPSKLDAAKAHRDKLLQFQAQNARRTKVVDETADFETPNVASTLWMTPTQRALALKKQQRIQREMDEKARPEWEKKKTVMSLDIKGGKVRRVYHSAPAEPTPEVSEPEPVDEVRAEDSPQGQRTFSRNPLLAAGGLMRPVWRAPEIKQAEAVGQTERKQTWRRVQDDNDDNEQWILDGGIHGHAS
ncbi:hypothetical protein N7530_011704 [Penicillium desertorum]|uniref:TRIP4/RQT4 C2HC5-type zinc finger domain-containing protein n=1 Tax=Penicillium desertorum TaxID=1303715 RepID=A0A9W9WDX2_9EURO|nr:hypothetical protein N7530_011704 [Penicillium desertorum]